MSDAVENPDGLGSSSEAKPGRRLSDNDAAVLAEHISGLAAAGLPLVGGLRAMADEIPSGSLRRVLIELAAQLERGLPLESALEKLGSSFPEHVRRLVQAGVQSGRLGEILAEYVRYRSLATQLRRKTVSSMAYPMILIIVFLSIFSFMMVLIVPKFKRIFMDFGVELPNVSLMLLSLSDWAVEYWQFLLGVTFFGPIGVWLVSKLLLPPAPRQRLLYHVPLLGSQWRWTGLAQFARLLAMLIECELPLPSALQLAGEGVGDAEIADAARELSQLIARGEPLAASAAKQARFPAGLTQCLNLGESTQSVAESLRSAAEMCEGRAMIDSELVFRIAPPITMICILCVLGFIVSGLFLPLIKLISELSG